MKDYDPYNNNPFATDKSEIKNERDANTALMITARATRIKGTDLVVVITNIVRLQGGFPNAE